MARIQLSSAVKKYGAQQVIHGVDIDIEDGEFTVLVGPSGCGKSTLLRMIAGLESISGGEISIGERVVNDLRPKERGIAMVFQNYALYPHMTVAENMGFALRLSKAGKGEIDQKVRAAADILDLGPLLERYPRELSGGQRQRVAMGRAIVRDPSVFLFDEPLSNLDAKLRVRMRTEIRALHQKLRTTVVYVTHDQIEAMTMADKIIVLEGGHVSQVGSPLELYDRPANRFVGTFIGSPSMNILPAVAEPGGLLLENGQGLVAPHALAAGRSVEFGIRPEHLTLCGDDAGIAARVLVVEPTGAETHVVCDVAGTEVTAALRDRVDFGPGHIMHLAPDPGRAHFFDPETGLSLAAPTH
ncbi:ABC transporter ATP-binding protein [Halovulum sp. GXIMD14794]